MNPLLVPELFHCILDYVVISPPEGPANREEHATLAALARTCRAFSEPSLDYLWRRLDSLLPLLRSFADVVDEARAKVVANHPIVMLCEIIHGVDRPLHPLSNGLSSIDTPPVSKNSAWELNICPYIFCNIRISSCQI